jgi:hypothetical protein
LHGYFAKFGSLVLRSNFAKFQVHIAIFGYFVKSILPLCQLHLDQIAKVLIAMSTFPSLQLHITIWLFSQIVYLAELLSPLHLVNNLNKLQAAHKFLIFWADQCLNFFYGLPKLLPQKIRLTLFFSFPTGCPGLLPSFIHSLSLSLSLSLFDLMALGSLRGALSKFKLPPKLIF